MNKSASDPFIVYNSDADWKVRSYLKDWCELSRAIDIATVYFEIGALLTLEEKWQAVDRICNLLRGTYKRNKYRQLITAAVTGKIDVRHHVNQTGTYHATTALS